MNKRKCRVNERQGNENGREKEVRGCAQMIKIRVLRHSLICSRLRSIHHSAAFNFDERQICCILSDYFVWTTTYMSDVRCFAIGNVGKSTYNGTNKSHLWKKSFAGTVFFSLSILAFPCCHSIGSAAKAFNFTAHRAESDTHMRTRVHTRMHALRSAVQWMANAYGYKRGEFDECMNTS